MNHPLNVTEAGGGHGILFGPEVQPVLNANDWRPDVDVIRFEDYTPREQNIETGEAVEKKGFEKFQSGAIEFFTAQKCAPIIDQVWYETNDRYLVNDAPVLLMEGMLFRKRDGIIAIEVTEPGDNDGKGAEKAQEQVQADVEQANAEVRASVDRALAEGEIDAETAQFMRDGYSEALQFANGGINMVNRLFADLTTDGGDAYSSSEVRFNKLKLYLQHNDSPLAEAGCGSMKLSDSSDGGATLGDAVISTLAQGRKSVQESKGMDKQAVPIITGMLNHLT